MKLYRVRQQLVSKPLQDVSAAVSAALDAAGLRLPSGGEIAITAGSRGIANIPEIIRAAGDWLKARNCRPFIVPCMGSHNGGTAEGQREMIESLGITESAMDMEIRAGMEVVRLGSVSTGDVFMDRFCYESDGVLLINRIKLHTAFSGSLQSGLVKMMVVGMGKTNSARTFHSAPNSSMYQALVDMGDVILKTGKVIGGIAILEDGFDQTAEVHAVTPGSLMDAERRLLERHRDYFPRLPVKDLDVLIVDQIGKNLSGTGMDTNVIGYRGLRDGDELSDPRIAVIAALRLHPGSCGNAFGVGLADFITRDLRDAIDESKTALNAVTTGEMLRAKIPVTLESDETLVQALAGRFGQKRWMFIPNTLHLETLYVSEALADELREHPQCVVDPVPVELEFSAGRHRLDFS